MKSQNANQAGGMAPRPGAGRRGAPVRIPNLPMEWMDPMSWRLPSGKALAEFALQAGFLAPLMLGSPRMKKRKPVTAKPMDTERIALDQRAEEGPEHSGTFRESR